MRATAQDSKEESVVRLYSLAGSSSFDSLQPTATFRVPLCANFCWILLHPLEGCRLSSSARPAAPICETSCLPCSRALRLLPHHATLLAGLAHVVVVATHVL